MLFRLDNVHKHYGHFEALKGISLEVDSLSVGLLGPNGAGKSTLIKTLLGLINMSSGQAEILGHRVPEQSVQIRQLVGYMPENDCFLPYMTALQYVSFSGQLCGMPRSAAFRRAHEVLYYVGLGEARYRKLEGFSTGMKQRAKLAQALVHGPKIIFLDEPTNGLDPAGRDEMLALVEDIKAQGVHIVLSSHILHDVERVCESVIMLNHGELLYAGSVHELKSDNRRVLVVNTKNQNEMFRKLLQKQGFNVEAEGTHLKIHLNADQDSQEVIKHAVDNRVELRHFVPGELTLETAFLTLLEPSYQGGAQSPEISPS